MFYSQQESDTRTKYAMAFGYMQALIQGMAKGHLDMDYFKKEVENIDDIWKGIHNIELAPEDFRDEVLKGNY